MKAIRLVLSSVLILLWLLGFLTQAWEARASSKSELPNYEVYVLLSVSVYPRFNRFTEYPSFEISKKEIEEMPICFAYIRGPNVEMIFGTGPREPTFHRAGAKASFDFVDQKTLLASIDADADRIGTAILTSTRFSRTGGLNAFPNAVFVIQKKEFDAIPVHYSIPEDNEKIRQFGQEGRLKIIDGDQELAPGITAHLISGETHGTQCLSVSTADGLVVLAGQGVWTYENLKYNIPTPSSLGADKQKESYARVRDILGGSDALLVPGFDMEVFRRFPKITDRVVQVKLK